MDIFKSRRVRIKAWVYPIRVRIWDFQTADIVINESAIKV